MVVKVNLDEVTGPMMVPHSREDEEAVIGGVFINPQAIMTMEPQLQPGDFYIVRNGWIWDVLLTLKNELQPVDLLTVTNMLDDRGQIADIGGSAYLTGLMNNVPSSLHLDTYALRVHDCALRRDNLVEANRIASESYDMLKPVAETRAESAGRLLDFHVNRGATHINTWMDRGYDLLERVSKNPEIIAGISTGLSDLDKVFGDGLLPGMNLLIGEPGLGKSILAQQVAINLVDAKVPGAFYAGEMDWQDMYLRFLGSWGKLRVSEMRHGKIDFARVIKVQDYLADKPFWVDDPKGMSTAELRADLTRLKSRHGIKWMVFDYLDDLADEQGKMEGWKRSEILAVRLQRILVELNIRGLVIHEVNKEGMDNPGMAGIAGGKKVSYRSICAVQILPFVRDGDYLEGDENLRSIKNIKQNRLVEGGREWCDLYKDPLYPKFGQSVMGVVNDRSQRE